MQIGRDDHFHHIVVPAWPAYLRAEARLSRSFEAAEDAQLIEATGFAALREAGSAALYLHHFSDLVAADMPIDWPATITCPPEVRDRVDGFCRNLRGEERSDDVLVLGDVVDALEHGRLTHRADVRKVSSREAVLDLHDGRVVIVTNGSERAMTGVFQNVIDAWRTTMDWPHYPPSQA